MKRHRWACLLVVLAVSGAVAAQDGATAPREEPVPLFTNDDLEKYGPSDAPDRPVSEAVAGGDQDWNFVNKFIEGQYKKIEAEREHALELSERDARRGEPEWDGWNGRLLLAPRSPLWWYDWYGPPVRPIPHDNNGIRTPSARAGRPIEKGHYVSRRGGGSDRSGGHGRGSGGGEGRGGSGGGDGSRR